MRKLLIANRGEIAVRVIRAAREMGIATVAVYSEADASGMAALLADESVCIGPAEPGESYLKIERIIEAARQTGADAVHPGYGFLSERAEFSDACWLAGLTFVGPSAAAMKQLGSKIAAKQIAQGAGVPITPGYFEPNATHAELENAAKAIGYPVMLKASAGGGGRGMRVVRGPEDFRRELEIASNEAQSAFGEGAMMIEKLIARPRHVEAQLLADSHGSIAVLFERECSLQRRHQKLIEESPSPAFALHPDAWSKMREAAASLAHATGYQNAGTVEFLMDDAGELYFMEVNARLQVEHPVTELVTGVDLVKWQLRIAQGVPLRLDEGLMHGERSALRGHAIEARIIAEDPARGFLPSLGRIRAWAEPRMPGVRVDTACRAGSEVTRHYDSLLAKVISRGETREEAIARLKAALMDFHILGISTNIEYLLDVISHPAFAAGDFDTGFLEREFGSWSPAEDLPPGLGAIAASAKLAGESEASVEPAGAWASDGFRVSALTK